MTLIHNDYILFCTDQWSDIKNIVEKCGGIESEVIESLQRLEIMGFLESRSLKQTSFYKKYEKPQSREQFTSMMEHFVSYQNSEIESIKRLKNTKSKVSCHYLINRKGLVFQMVKDNKVAWHAGKSKWKAFRNLNENSIGIELVNKGHEFGYQNFSENQIKNLVDLCKFLKKKYKINEENFLGH